MNNLKKEHPTLMNNIRLIATDMDHTLLTEDGKLPPKIGDYIQRLHNVGVQFTIASGRPIYTLQRLFEKEKNELAYICDNGGAVYVHGKNVYKALIPVADYHEMIRFTDKTVDGHPIVCGLDAAYIPKADARFLPFYKTFYANVIQVDDLSTVTTEANKFTIYFPKNNSQDQYDQVFAPRFADRYSVVVSDANWIDIMNPGVNKGQGMRQLGAKLGVHTDQMMAFGATFNDAEMLQTVKYGYRVANANPGIYQYADYVTGSNDDYGVLQVLDQVLAAHA